MISFHPNVIKRLLNKYGMNINEIDISLIFDD